MHLKYAHFVQTCLFHLHYESSRYHFSGTDNTQDTVDNNSSNMRWLIITKYTIL